MDRVLTNIIKTSLDDYESNFNKEEAPYPKADYVSEMVFSAGYRLDPYPMGMGKDDLIKLAEHRWHLCLTFNNALFREHESVVREKYGTTLERHRELSPKCVVCGLIDSLSGEKK